MRPLFCCNFLLPRSWSDPLKQFKTEVSRVIGAEGKYLRLISAGKMLNPDDAHVKDFGLTENCYVHCVVTAAPPRLQLPSLTPEQAEEEVRFSEFSGGRKWLRSAGDAI